jgi:hypothetical protein
MKPIASLLSLALLTGIAAAGQQPCAERARLYNTAKQKLLDGKQIFSYSISLLSQTGQTDSERH